MGDAWANAAHQGIRPFLSKAVAALIRDKWRSNPTWASPRIVGELGKLGNEGVKSTVGNDCPRIGKPSPPTWRAVLNHPVKDPVTCDGFTVPPVTCRVLFGLMSLPHDRHRIVHGNLTEHPTAQWTAQPSVSAFPCEPAPRYRVRDRDAISGEPGQPRLRNMGLEAVKIACTVYVHIPTANGSWGASAASHERFSSRRKGRSGNGQRSADSILMMNA